MPKNENVDEVIQQNQECLAKLIQCFRFKEKKKETNVDASCRHA